MWSLTTACLVILVTVKQGSTCMPVRSPEGVIPITDAPEETTIMLTTVPPTTCMTTSAPLCPAPSNTAPLLADSEFREFFNRSTPYYNLTTHEEATCSKCADGLIGFYTPATNAYPENAADQSTLLVSAVACPDVCICTASGTCYTRGPGRFPFYLYSYCDGMTCGVYFVLGATGSFIPTDGDGTTYLPDPEVAHPVTDGDVYLKGVSIGCSKCVRTTCI